MGVFNSANLAPRAQAGNCRIFRAAGEANLEGVCQGELPQAVAMFNGAGSGIAVTSSTSTGVVPTTLVAWVEINSYSSDTNIGRVILSTYNSGGSMAGYLFSLVGPSAYPQLDAMGSGGAAKITSNANLNRGQWYQIVATYNSVYGYLYVNGALQAQGALSNAAPAPTVEIGCGIWVGCTNFPQYNFNGQLADIQIYNTSLDANQIQALYLEGIGGAPVAPQSVVGWWPLNGNMNDYSGNNNNGAAIAVTYTSAWTSGYATP